MRRYILAVTLLCLVADGILPMRAFADFFNQSLLRERTEYNLQHREEVYVTSGDSLIAYPAAPDRRIMLHPPRDWAQPEISYSDTIKYEQGQVKRMREIEGLRVEPYRIIPLDEYIQENFESNFERRWADNTRRKAAWEDTESSTGGGGAADLDFSLPVGRTFARFVGGDTRLIIDGSQRIEFTGTSEWTEGQIETAAARNSSFPSLTMKQEPRFKIRGQVGDRISVDIQQDPQGGLSNLEENISIKYQGEEQEILQYIEAGSTSLNLEGATFAGYHGTSKGLFGIRTESQLGPLKLTAIASQEKSESATKTFRGSAEETSTQIKDYQYKANTYFFLDHKYRNVFATGRNSMDVLTYNPADSIVVFDVYVDDGNINNNLNEATLALRGVATPMEITDDSINTDAAVDGYYHRLDPSEYFVDRSLGFITFSRTIQDDWTVGVYMETQSGAVYGDLAYDTEDENSKIYLKLIKRKKQRPTDIDTWNLEWKNVYDLGQRNIDPEGLEIRIKKVSTDGPARDTQNGVPYIQILGLDKQNELGVMTPDNKVDLNRGFVNFARGELIFPLLEPFNSDQPPAGVDYTLDEKLPVIYDSQNRSDKEVATRYFIEVSTSQAQSVYTIPSLFGVMEGTEQVRSNGRLLTRGTDYNIDYMTGRVTLLTQEALADVTIDYSERNAIQEMQKTLLGLRGEFDLFSDSRIGGTLLFKNESTRDRKVRLGQEPSRTLLLDTDARFNFQSRMLTSALDRLPLLVASTPSTIRLEAEVARSLPNMNTRGVVYVDDFEGSHNATISVIRSNWTTASPPDRTTSAGNPLTRGRLIWYNPLNRIKSSEIWPKKETAAGDNTVHVLTLAYGKADETDAFESFAGVQSPIYGSGLDMSRSRFIEIWARGNRGELKVDIGSVSEDFFPYDQPNGRLDTEDQPIPGQGHGDNILTKEEDTGLDGLFDHQEPGYSTGNPDPDGDDFTYDPNDKYNYAGINGTEGNASDGDRLGLPDTEDINDNGILDTKDSYYEYTLDFTDSSPLNQYLVEDSVPEGDPYGWRLFRIPLWNNPLAEVGGISAPDSTLIEFTRLWVTGVDTTFIQIASFEIVESTWLEQGIYNQDNDNITNAVFDRIRVTTANTHENSEYYPPPGVKAEIDPESKIRKREQSLVLKAENVNAGNSAFIYRNFERMDFTDYTALKMYVHGPEEAGFPVAGDTASDIDLVLRFGGDTSNYYEYRTPVYQGWASDNTVDVDFARCTALKLNPDYELYASYPDSSAAVAVTDSVGNKVYSIRGRPSLDNIKILSIGLWNRKTDEPLNADIWIDELRMDDLRDMTGTAARVNLNTDLSGFINLTANATRRSSDFHDMNSKKGSGSDITELNSSVKVNLDRLTPRRWRISLPVSAAITDNSSLPRLKSGSDIILPDSQKRQYESSSTSRKFHVNFSKGVDNTLQGVQGFITNWALEKTNVSFDWGRDQSHSPTVGDNWSERVSFRGAYDVAPQPHSFKPFNWLPVLPNDLWESFAGADFSYTPSQLNYSVTYDQRDQFKTNIDAISDTTQTKTTTEELNFGYSPFSSLRYTYRGSRQNDLYLNQEVSFEETNQISYTAPKIFNFSHTYNYQSSYSETDNPRYSLSSQLGSKKLVMNRRLTINGDFALNTFIEDLSGKPKPPRPPSTRKQTTNEDWQETGEPQPQQEPEPEPEEEAKPAGTGVRTKVMMAVSRTLSPITFNYSNSDDINFAGISTRPGFLTRFGKGTVDAPAGDDVLVRNNSTGNTKTYSLRTKINLPWDLGLSSSGQYRTTEKNSVSADSRSEDTTFPDLNLNWTGVENKIPFADILFNNLTLTTGYQITKGKSWQNKSPRPTSDKVSHGNAPLISLSGAMLGGVQTSFSVTSRVEDSNTLSGAIIRLNRKETQDMNLSLRYRINPSSSLPLFGNLNSAIDLALTMSTQHSKTSQRIGKEKLSVIGNDSSWSVAPQANYSFSQKFRGGAEMRFENKKDMRNKVHKVREVTIWGELQF